MLDIQGLSKRYGSIVANDDVTFTVPPGRIVGFVGPNGAGKSTTMRSVMGLVDYDAGSVAWHGRPVDAEILKRIGYLPEQRGLYPKMKVADQIAYFAQLKGLDRPTAQRRARDLLDDLGLGDRADEPLQKLSHGNQQRVQLSVALASEPELLILDEPFNGLDPVAAGTLEEVLVERVRQGAAVLFSSHQLDLVERVCDDVVIIVEGRIRATGTVDGVRSERGEPRIVVRVEVPAELTTAGPRLPAALDGLTVISHHATEHERSGEAPFVLETAMVAASDPGQLEGIVARAGGAGRVREVHYELPTLTELFAELVVGVAESGAGTPDEVDEPGSNRRFALSRLVGR